MKFVEIIDNAVIEFVHLLCEKVGFILTPIMRLVSILGEKCWSCLLVAVVMLFRKKTRWIGATAILAVFIGFIIADFGLKPTIMRLRPYMTNIDFQKYWELAGAYHETNYSMPSGHTVGFTAFFVSLIITSPKKDRDFLKKFAAVCITLMVLSRCYFMHHFLSDCVVGFIIGVISAYIAKIIIKGIHYICKKYEDLKFFDFILNFDPAGKE